jgi:uncharacterized protein (TIGR02118 family)
MELIAFYKMPEDPDEFDERYFGTHLPLLEKVPGLQGTSVTRFSRTVMGEKHYMMAVMRFADMDTLKEGLNSPEMAVAGENLNSFAKGLVTLVIGEAERGEE